MRTGEESAERRRAQPGTRRKLQEGEGKKSQVSGGWGWDADALPIGTQGGPGGVGRRERRRAAERGWGAAAHPHAGRGGGLAAGGCPPPLPRPAHKGARGRRFLPAPQPNRSRCFGAPPRSLPLGRGLWALPRFPQGSSGSSQKTV